MLSTDRSSALLYNQKMRSRELLDKKIVCEDLAVGEVKGFIVDTAEWKVNHLEVNLDKDTAWLVLGTRKGGIRNLLAVSAI